MDELQSLKDLKDIELDLHFCEVLNFPDLLLDHCFEVIIHEFEDNVLNKFVLVVPRIVEVLNDGNIPVS